MNNYEDIRLGPNEFVFVSGEPAKDLYLVKKGKINILVEKGNSVQLIGHRREKDFLGEHSLMMGDGFRKLSAIADEETTLIKIPYNELLEVIHQCPFWLKELLINIVSRSKDLHNIIIEHHIEDEENPIKPLNGEEIREIRDGLKKYRKEHGIEII